MASVFRIILRAAVLRKILGVSMWNRIFGNAVEKNLGDFCSRMILRGCSIGKDLKCCLVEKVFLSFCCVWKDIRDPLCQMDCEDFCVDEFLVAAMLRMILRDCCVGKDSEGLQFGEGF